MKYKFNPQNITTAGYKSKTCRFFNAQKLPPVQLRLFPLMASRPVLEGGSPQNNRLSGDNFPVNGLSV